MSRCCRCGCDKINFKAFDFANGDLLWQALLHEPAVATNGDVYDVELTAITAVSVVHFSHLAGDTVTLPDADATEASTNEMRIRRRDANGGEIATSPVVGIGASFWDDYLQASWYRVNDVGDMSATLSMSARKIHRRHMSATSTKYYFEKTHYDVGDITFQLDSGSSATCDFSDGAAAVQSTLATAFASECSAVTVAGTSFASQLMEITFEWTAAGSYVESVTYPPPGVGNFYQLLNVRSGEYGTIGGSATNDVSTSNTYSRGFIWQDNGDLFLVGCAGHETGHPAYDATIISSKSFRTSDDPWTVVWHHEPFIGYDTGPNAPTPIVLYVGAKNGKVAITYPISAVHDDKLWPPRIDGHFSTWTTYDDDGTNFSDNRFGLDGVDAQNIPNGFAIEDSGSRVAVSHTQSIAQWSWEDTVTFQPVTFEFYGQALGNECAVYTENTSDVDSALSRGDFTPTITKPAGLGPFRNTFTGFTATAVGFVDLNGATHSVSNSFNAETVCTVMSKPVASSNQANTDLGIATYVGPSFETNIVNTQTLAKIRYFPVAWTPYVFNHARTDADTQWRFRIEGYTTTDDVTTSWFTETDTAATVNTNLLSLFGTDNDGTAIFEIDDESPGAICEHALPLWNRWIVLRSNMAQTNNDDYLEAGLPELLSSTVSLPARIAEQTPRISLEFQSFNTARENQFGALSWSTGEKAWSRNFGKNNAAKTILRAQLHDGQLHVLSTKQCSEDQEGYYGYS